MSTIAVVGLGYVGLPLAVAFGKQSVTIGFDSSIEKVESYKKYCDPTGEVSTEDLRAATKLTCTVDASAIAVADYIIVAVPSPIDDAHRPDFGPLLSASRIIGENMKNGATVIYESTVYPGATEEICIPALEEYSGMQWQRDFRVGYSPERVNPGDKEHTLATICKVVAGDSQETLDDIAALYGSVVKAGVHRATSIQVAEAAKVIENTQRDLNIALMNELAIIFNKIGIDTVEVLEAAETKWNFLSFRPGLVGGHCIGVDPYYLTHKADQLGYHPQVILAGRRINDGMGKYVAEQAVKFLANNGCQVNSAKVNILGFTFKEDCPDLRNTRAIDVITELESYGLRPFVHDPVADHEEAKREYGVDLVDWEQLPRADLVIVVVAHRDFLARPLEDFSNKLVSGGCFIDVKAKFDRVTLENNGFNVWRL